MNKSSLIDKYFQNSLSSEERLILEKLLKNDSDFYKEFYFQKNVATAIAILERENIKKYLQGIERENFKKNSVSFSLKWLLAASIAILTCIGASFFISSDDYHTDLYTQNFTIFENVIYPLNRDDLRNSLGKEAFIYYENKEFFKAIEGFKKVYNKTNNEEMFLYIGISYLAVKEFEKANLILQEYLTTQGKYISHAHWYLALGNLALNKKNHTKKHLSIVIRLSQGFKNKDAKDLLEKL
ncbi:tetratricopeptide repeat protein [Tenacibaculum jejuense]|uniref:Tetratricopeptide repeat protein n=1 Tax=Tenacibaculum jejuense TaxID=584609 RepID=A0A238U7K1_9FLAO|nr:hypothetical protein [Tenacibaculum jejuense]SNR15072.1 conserved protein of unknown function [Tenacibaculum jejuense]